MDIRIKRCRDKSEKLPRSVMEEVEGGCFSFSSLFFDRQSLNLSGFLMWL